MPTSPSARASLGALLAVATLLVSGCGLEAKPDAKVTKPGDPAPAERALRLYLDDDRCDVMSDDFAERLDPDPDRARRLCEDGVVPVDALVQRGQYTVKDAELIDGEGIIRIVLDDGGIRDYTLVPGGPEAFQVDQVKSTTVVEYGESLRLQARESIKAEPVDAKITVESLRRVPVKALSEDEFTTGLDHYYLLRVRIRSRSDRAQLLGSDGFQLATKEGFPIAEPREMYSDIGEPLEGILKPGAVNVGDVFFASPEQVRPEQVRFVYGNQYVGDTLVWNRPGFGQSGRKGG
jgi:hypothetical protein